MDPLTHDKGEETDSVQVYDTCDEIRKKISAYLRKPNTTAAQFCRDLLAQYHTDEKKPSRIQSTQLTKFRGYKGADTGNTSCVFYAAYVFFEKVRLAEGKPKSKHRLEMEEIWGGKGGFDISRGHHRGYIAFFFLLLLSLLVSVGRGRILTMAAKTDIWSWRTRDLCKISTVELRSSVPADCAPPCKSLWFLTTVNKACSKEYARETVLSRRNSPARVTH